MKKSKLKIIIFIRDIGVRVIVKIWNVILIDNSIHLNVKNNMQLLKCVWSVYVWKSTCFINI